MTHACRYDGPPTAPLGPLVHISCTDGDVEASGTVGWEIDNFYDLVVVECPFCDEAIVMETDPSTVAMFRTWAGDIADEARPPVVAASRLEGVDGSVDVFARAAGCRTGEQADEWRHNHDHPRPVRERTE